MPLAAVAVMLGSTSGEVWRSFIARASQSIRVCIGNADERNEALRLIQGRRRKFILEPTALQELQMLDALEAVQAICGKLAIVQSTLEELRHQIAELDLHPEGHLRLFEQDGGYHQMEIGAEDIARERMRLQTLLDWARAHCEILPAVPERDPDPSIAEAMQRVLGPAVYDTMLAAQSGRCVLLSDDLHLRQIAHSELGVQGVWIQPVLMCAVGAHLKPDGYQQAVIRLTNWRHDFTSVSADELLYAARRGHWRVTRDFKTLAATLSLARTEFQSNVKVCMAFLRAIWTLKPDGPTRAQAAVLTRALLAGVDAGQSAHHAQYLRTLLTFVKEHRLSNKARAAIQSWFRAAGLFREFA
jgi:hypothetical protein